jgi:lipopolysaccharide export LptBFGC system permease protein LptF
MKIWQKYLFSQLLKTFLFFLICLLLIYMIVDLSAHGVRFLSKSSFSEIAFFYLNTFASILDLLLTLTFLLATLKVLITLNANREIVALQMAGLSKKKLLTPFFLVAAFLSLICYLNSQWFASNAQEIVSNFKAAHKTKKNKPDPIRIFTASLKDESEIIYQKYDPKNHELFDVFWVRSPSDIWQMKTLKINNLQGCYVNHLQRNSLKQLEKTESFISRSFSELPWSDEIILHRFIPYENRSISTLILQACSRPADGRVILSHLYYKLLVPLMPFLVLFAISPLILYYSRNTPIFFITAYSIFGFIALKVLFDGMLILGENQVIPSSIAILGPFFLILSLFTPKFARMH